MTTTKPTYNAAHLKEAKELLATFSSAKEAIRFLHPDLEDARQRYARLRGLNNALKAVQRKLRGKP